MEVVYYLSCGMKSKHIVQITGVSRLTISHYRKALEEVLNEKFMQDEIQIGGENTIIEADESLIGHRKYNRGRSPWCLDIRVRKTNSCASYNYDSGRKKG